MSPNAWQPIASLILHPQRKDWCAIDPQQTWHDLAKAVNEQKWHYAAELAEHLVSWLAKSGFPPKITGMPEFDKIAARATCEAITAWEFA